ncbi:unnamed protein product [Vitrella brassicaformis CCMP3155]|uniref:Uncharacterized protein n=1 Tax=Vitrella brassicaformis (strain CCMP3155) TaxID=1169540 RepID=A0A0G4EGF2_VITBC|nr:unnamed protein product [Vitrella brassicaformis CCMP3155]|eukprot:CEL94479.1 unnamed protein product [Vitrella brassicaformis CCMP3155]
MWLQPEALSSLDEILGFCFDGRLLFSTESSTDISFHSRRKKKQLALYGCICDGDITSRADAGRPLYRDPRYDGANGAARHEDYLSDLTDASREEDDKLRLLSVVDVLPTECR